MNLGKQTCRILKEIRRRIAEANDIEYVTSSECQYKGECRGTCPKCEAEMRYLETQLASRRLTGKAVSIAGISVGMLLGGCNGGSTKTPDSEIHNVTMIPLDSINKTNVLDSDSLKESISECPDYELEGEVIAFESVEAQNKQKNNNQVSFNIDSSDEPLEVIRVYGGAEVIVEPIRYGPDHYYQSCEHMPDFQGGGDPALQEYINKHLIYPEEAKQKGIEGRVIIQMGIDTLGSVTSAKIIRSKDSIFNEEALRVVKSLPNFIPGTNEDKQPVNVYYTVPVYFRLKDRN